MPGMPFHLEKGHWLVELERYLNDPYDRLEVLNALKSRKAMIHEHPFFEGSRLDGDWMYGDPKTRQVHLSRDWFGRSEGGHPDFIGQALDQLDDGEVHDAMRDWADARPARDHLSRADVIEFTEQLFAEVEERESGALDAWPSTGFWHQYHGDVHAIVKETLIRTIEVSFGLKHGDTLESADDAPRQLSIEVFWKCPQRWFEGWVTWRQNRGASGGQVMMMLATPGSGRALLEDPINTTEVLKTPDGTGSVEDDLVFDEQMAQGPDGVTSRRGMWVVTHEQHVTLPTPPTAIATGSGDWVVPPFGPSYVGLGSVVCIQPHIDDGGLWRGPRQDDNNQAVQETAS